jgi:hypothetical protein
MEGARIIGVLSGTPSDPRVAYLEPGTQIDPDISTGIGELAPTQVFRFAAKCEKGGCSHFSEGRCSLGDRVVAHLPEIVDSLPVCQIRSSCRWFAEQGGSICRRCPQVVTMIPRGDDALNRAAISEMTAR